MACPGLRICVSQDKTPKVPESKSNSPPYHFSSQCLSHSQGSSMCAQTQGLTSEQRCNRKPINTTTHERRNTCVHTRTPTPTHTGAAGFGVRYPSPDWTQPIAPLFSLTQSWGGLQTVGRFPLVLPHPAAVTSTLRLLPPQVPHLILSGSLMGLRE